MAPSPVACHFAAKFFSVIFQVLQGAGCFLGLEMVVSRALDMASTAARQNPDPHVDSHCLYTHRYSILVESKYPSWPTRTGPEPVPKRVRAELTTPSGKYRCPSTVDCKGPLAKQSSVWDSGETI
jgi:hypothetical protein